MTAEVFVLIHEDRHADTEALVYADRSKAIAEAKRRAREFCRFDEDFSEELSNEMTQAGWIYHATYSCEGDSIRVVKTEVCR